MPDLIDPVAVWRGLTPDQQERIGAAAVVYLIGTLGRPAGEEPTAFDAAETAGFQALLDCAEAGGLLAAEIASGRRPDLAAIGVRSCRVCGCTDAVGCPEGCCWVGPDLCSSCVDVDAGTAEGGPRG